jgi:hypothetical protein
VDGDFVGVDPAVSATDTGAFGAGTVGRAAGADTLRPGDAESFPVFGGITTDDSRFDGTGDGAATDVAGVGSFGIATAAFAGAGVGGAGLAVAAGRLVYHQ